MRLWLLGGFKVSVESGTIEGGAWRLRKAANLVKLLALSPSHRLHREQVMDTLWPDLGMQAAPTTCARPSTPPVEPWSLVGRRILAT
jgi:DNA-binding SARP family transcriptional activator